MNCCLYEGTVRHRRHAPRGHQFQYKLFWAYLDLGDLDEAFGGRRLWSHRRAAPARFRRADHMGDPARPLDECVRDLVHERVGYRPEGPIRLLTHLRYWGYVFNPVSFYYCYAPDGTTLEAVVAEVTNTPWKEMHPYVLPVRGQPEGTLRWAFPKAFHVSPFFGMEQTYEWAFTAPGERLGVHMRNLEGGENVFDATMALHRVPWTDAHLRSALFRYPFLTLKIISTIHWQAVLLWFKKTPFHSHPLLSSTST